MKALETGEILPGQIWALKNNVNNMYIVRTSDGYLAMDAGANILRIDAAFHRIGIDEKDVRWVLLTHTDYDHVASLRRFSNAQIFLGRNELQLIDGRTARARGRRNRLPVGVDPNALALLGDEQVLELGGMQIKCIETPGHTIGSMSYLINGQWLFTGDALRLKNGRTRMHPFAMNAHKARNSVKKLDALIREGCHVFTAHYGLAEPRQQKKLVAALDKAENVG